jgi:Ca2+-binding RTX toxin-like protein
MRKTILVLASVALAMVVAGGVAWAANIQCRANTKCIGTDQADTMKGTPLRDSIYAKYGEDTVYGRGSSDKIYGSLGHDKIFGGAGRDWLVGGSQQDTIYGQSGPDWLAGNYGDDSLYGGAGVDSLWVEPNNASDVKFDDLHGGKNRDYLYGSGQWPGTFESGMDHFYGDSGNDYIHVERNAGPEESPPHSIKPPPDVVDCGPGYDEVWFNEGADVVNDTCEIKHPQ